MSKRKAQQPNTSNKKAKTLTELPDALTLIAERGDDLPALLKLLAYSKSLEKAANNAVDNQRRKNKEQAKKTGGCACCGKPVTSTQKVWQCGTLDGSSPVNKGQDLYRNEDGCGQLCHIECMTPNFCGIMWFCGNDCMKDFECVDCDSCSLRQQYQDIEVEQRREIHPSIGEDRDNNSSYGGGYGGGYGYGGRYAL